MDSDNSPRLGIFDGHNAAACLYRDAHVEAIMQEERLVREKNFCGFPTESVRWLLDHGGLAPEDVGQVCLGAQWVYRGFGPTATKQNFDDRFRGGLSALRRRVAGVGAYRNWRAAQQRRERVEDVTRLGFRDDQVWFSDHHKAHAATVYYGLRRDDDPYLILTLDGGGDMLSGAVWVGEAGSLRLVDTIDTPDSLGQIYAVVTHLLGFAPLEHEYKLMGMAPYAAPQYAEEPARVLSSYVDFDPAHPLRFRRTTHEPLSHIGARIARDLPRVRFDSLCAGLQLSTERLLAEWTRRCVQHTGIGRVLAAGGVFMNVKANKVLSELDEVTFFEAFPSCGDESLPFGACYLSAVEQGEQPQRLQHCYLGNDLSADECHAAVAEAGEAVSVEEPQDMAARVAALLADGEIVARAAGRMEFGARALGNRSILADPRNQDVVRVINQMIKKRDFWMPFAPVVLRREAGRYFDNPKDLPSPYMMNTFDSTDQRDGFMAAVHNADLTARPQLVEDGQNAGYEAILTRFGERTGRHVLLNTSFNLHGSPVVCSAADAMGVLLNSGLQRLVLGPLLVTKRTST